MEASLVDVVEEAERYLQQESAKTNTKDGGTKQDQSVDESDSGHAPMEVNDGQSSVQTDKIVDTIQPQGSPPDQMVSESGTVRGIKGRVKEQIASNQSKMMIQGLMMKKQQPPARAPLSVVYKAASTDEAQTSDLKAPLRRSGSQKETSNKESENVKRRSSSFRTNEAEMQSYKKPRGKAPPPPQDKVKAKQPQQIQSKPLDQSDTIPMIPVESNQVAQQNTEISLNQMTSNNFTPTNKAVSITPDIVKKVPPQVKPKTFLPKSKEAEDSAPVALERSLKAVQSKPHPSLSARTKSESAIKPVLQVSPKTDKRPAAIIESNNNGQKVLVLSPAGSKTNKDASVRILLPPPPPISPPCQEQESKKITEQKQDHNTPASNNEQKNITNDMVTNNSTVVSQSLHSDIIASHSTNKKEQEMDTSHVQLQKQDFSHLSTNKNAEDNEIQPLPHIVFQSLEDLPPTPPASPCKEVEIAEMKMVESELNDDDDNDDIHILPPPPAMDDLNIDEADGGVFTPIPPPDDFDPLSLPPPLPIDDDDVFDIIPPPPSSSIEDDIIVSTTNASSQPIEDDKIFEDLPVELPLPQTNDEVVLVSEGGSSDDEDAMFNLLLPDDVDLSESESDTELPTAMTENAVTELENTEPDALIDEVLADEDEETIRQLDIKNENITAELDSTKSDISVDAEIKDQNDTGGMQQSEDELSNIIASLETMLQDEPQFHEEQVIEQVDDTNTTLPPCTAWAQPPDDELTEVTPEVLDDGSKGDAQKDDYNQDPIASDDTNKIVTVKPEADTEMTDVKPKVVSPIPVRTAPPPPPLPPIGKVKSPQKITTSPINTTSPTKAKNPPPAVKPKPKRPISGSLTEEFQDELAEKLKRRQQKIHDWAKDDKPNMSPQTSPINLATIPSVSKTAALNTAPVVPNLQGASLNTQHTTSPIGTQEQMEQMQLLQNQLLQQQILQLQQQLQLLQQQVPQGQLTGNPTMGVPQQIVPQASTGMQFPQAVTGMQTGSGMQIPQTANFNIPMQQQGAIPAHNPSMPHDKRTFNAMSTPKTTKLSTSTDSESTRSESPPPPLPATSPPPLDQSPLDQVTRRNINKTVSDSSLHQRPSSQILRSTMLGEYEDVLDDIMEDIREVDRSTILKVYTTYCTFVNIIIFF